MTRKNTTAKIAAIIALIAIVWSIISTWVLVIYESYFSSPSSEISLTPEQLQEFINLSSSGNIQTHSWEVLNSQDENILPTTWEENTETNK